MAGANKILLVEDNQDLRETLVELLECAGYRVVAAETAERALALFEMVRAEIAVLMTDLRLPGMDGLELIDQVREAAPHRPPAVLVISSHADHPELQPRLHRSELRFLRKPFSFDSLLSEVEAAHRRARIAS